MRFDKYRRVCQRCRNKQEREHQAAKHADDQEPHPEDVAAELPAEVRASASNGVNTGLRAELHHRRERRRELRRPRLRRRSFSGSCSRWACTRAITSSRCAS